MNILAIDQGTSATKALVVGPGAEVLGRGEIPVRTRSVGADGVEADPEEQRPVVICRTPDATALGVAALARVGAGDAASPGEALGAAEVEAIVEPSITADQAAERISVFRSALDLTLARR